MDYEAARLRLTAYDRLPGFTPARRREPLQQNGSPAVSAHASWTTARCNRLLRPLSSRVAAFRKQRDSHVQQSTSGSLAVLPPIETVKTSNSGAIKPQHQKDPEWAPDNASKRKLKRTYSSRHGLGAQKSKNPLWQLSYENQVGPTATMDSFRPLAQLVLPNEKPILYGLRTSLLALLTVTNKSQVRPRTGARSLFSTCLRKVPDYIAEEQAFADEEDQDINSPDIAQVVYEDLESFGTASSGGWKPLKEVVRAHGISILGNAIRDGTIGFSIAHPLIHACIKEFAHEEAQHLCTELLSTLRPLSRPKKSTDNLFGSEISECMRLLWGIAMKSQNRGYLYRQLATLLENGVVPVEWFSCSCPDMNEFWDMTEESILYTREHYKDVSALLSVILKLSSSNHRSATTLNKRAISNEPTTSKPANPSAACGLNSLAHEKHDSICKTSRCLVPRIFKFIQDLLYQTLRPVESPKSWPCGMDSSLAEDCIHQMALQARQILDLSVTSASDSSSETLQLSRVSIPMLAQAIIASAVKNHTNSQNHLSVLTAHCNNPDTLEALSYYLCDLAEKLATSGSTIDVTTTPSAFESLQRIATLLQDSGATNLTFIQRLLTTAAFESADRNGQRKHLDWALEMEEMAEATEIADTDPSLATTMTPAKKHPKGEQGRKVGFRWEDAICEWVMRTPAPATSKAPPEAPVSHPAASAKKHPTEGRWAGEILPPARVRRPGNRLGDLSPCAHGGAPCPACRRRSNPPRGRAPSRSARRYRAHRAANAEGSGRSHPGSMRRDVCMETSQSGGDGGDGEDDSEDELGLVGKMPRFAGARGEEREMDGTRPGLREMRDGTFGSGGRRTKGGDVVVGKGPQMGLDCEGLDEDELDF